MITSIATLISITNYLLVDVKYLTKRQQFKISFLGEGMVGKTSLKNRIISGKFTDLYLTTLGIDFGIHNLKIIGDREEIEVQLALWDIAGQKNFAKIREGYFEGSKGAIVVFDVTKPDTLTKIKDNWIGPFFNKVGKMPILVLANKIDLKSERNISKNQIDDYLNIIKAELGLESTELLWIEVSAKEGTNVQEAIVDFSKLLVEQNKAKYNE